MPEIFANKSTGKIFYFDLFLNIIPFIKFLSKRRIEKKKYSVPTWKQCFILTRLSGFNCETIDPPVQESFEVPK